MPSKRRSKGRSRNTTPTPAVLPPPPTPPVDLGPREPQLVLTSDKRRGIYECDYCHTDVSQVPRIRCAVCHDFDLCLNCFAKTDHSTAVARLRAAAAADGGQSAAAATTHDGSHGYIVADSTRYPLFPTARALEKAGTKSDVGEPKSEVEDSKSDVGELKLDGGETKSDVAETTAEDKDISAMEIDLPSQGETTKKEGTDKEQETEPKMDGGDKEEGDKMDVDDSGKQAEDAKSVAESDSMVVGKVVQVHDDSKTSWTIEEDLRLLDAIKTCGLGNWVDIAEAISGQGSNNKTPKRCMERYFDDFLGRYGQILPQFTIVDDGDEEEIEDASVTNQDEASSGRDTPSRSPTKRRRLERQLSIRSSATSAKKHVKVVPTSSLVDMDKIWPKHYVPPLPNLEVGQEVGRDQSYRAELAFVKTITNAPTKEEADEIRREWMESRLNQMFGPTALPMRMEDIPALPGSELAGFMPRRGDFDIEWDNDAEQILADMEFSASDSPQDRQLKIQVIEIYNQKLDERERRKTFLLSRDLLDYRKRQQEDAQLPRDEMYLVRRMRIFERLHTPEEHKAFIGDILKAKRLRKEIAQLQTYRRMGITTMVEAEKFELDKNRREFHKQQHLQKLAQAAKPDVSQTSSAQAVSAGAGKDSDSGSTLWKQYRTTDRKHRRSINRGSPGVAIEAAAPKSDSGAVPGASAVGSTDSAKVEKMQVDETSSGKKNSPEKTAPAEAKDGASAEVPSTELKRPASEYDFLSVREEELCKKLDLSPKTYLDVKKVLIQESLTRGLLDRETLSSNKKTIVKIDVEKKGEVIDFMIRAGWISSKSGATSGQPKAVASTTTGSI